MNQIVIDHSKMYSYRGLNTNTIEAFWAVVQRQIVGQHHAHMIPKGLPGAGNILVFDNGGWGGFGLPNPSSPLGVMNVVRTDSRVIEFNPITLEKVWEYREDPQTSKFFSGFVSSAQRLLNGNTFICEGNLGRLFEVTPEKEIVWEYVYPFCPFDPEKVEPGS